MALAWVLVQWDSALQNAELANVHRCDSPGPGSPVFDVLISINTPIALPRALWDRHLSYYWSVAIFVVAVGILWHWVALNVQSWHQRGMVLRVFGTIRIPRRRSFFQNRDLLLIRHFLEDQSCAERCAAAAGWAYRGRLVHARAARSDYGDPNAPGHMVQQRPDRWIGRK
jgi:hypothetical protein